MKLRFLLLLCISFALSADEYLSQESIDAKVQEAFYGFVEASRSVGIVGSQRAAIARAQETVAELKRIAEKDPNRRYIMWRVSELEQQLFLEQEEVNLKTEYERVTEINRLVALFNEELFLARPSFAKLHALHQQVDALSVQHANQFAENINQKNMVLVNNLQNEVEDAFERGDYAGVEAIYMYAVKNRKYLSINISYYEQWSRRIQAKKNADYLRENIGRQMSSLSEIIQRNKISEARRNIEVIRQEIEGASRHLSSTFVLETNTKLSQMYRTVNSREDSLVQVGMSYAAARKADQASYYMDQVLRPAGVSPEKIAQIDREILRSSSVEKKENKQVAADVDAISANASKAGLSASELTAQVKMSGDSLKRHYEELEVQARNHFAAAHKAEFDSLQDADTEMEKNRTKADGILVKIAGMINTGKAADADKQMVKNENLLLTYSTPNLYIDTRRDLNRALGRDAFGDAQIAAVSKRQKESSPEQLEEKCVELTTQIYNALGKRDIQTAAGLFYRNESLLRKNSYDEAYQALKKQIVKEYSRKYMK